MDKTLVIGTLALFVVGPIDGPASAAGSLNVMMAQTQRSAGVRPNPRYGYDCSRGRGVDHPWACTALSPGITGDYSDYY